MGRRKKSWIQGPVVSGWYNLGTTKFMQGTWSLGLIPGNSRCKTTLSAIQAPKITDGGNSWTMWNYVIQLELRSLFSASTTIITHQQHQPVNQHTKKLKYQKMQHLYSHASSTDSCGRGTGRSQQSSRVNSAGGRDCYSPERYQCRWSRSPACQTAQWTYNMMDIDKPSHTQTNDRQDQALPEIDSIKGLA